MKAVVCSAIGGPSNVSVMDWPNRASKADEVRVAIYAAGINFGDLLVISDQYQVKLPPPFVLGTEGSGVVVDCGADVTDVVPGDRVLLQNNDVRECFADEVCLLAQRVAKVPEGLSLVDVAALPLNFGTAYYGLVHRGSLLRGETLLVHGASGGVGLAAVKLGRYLGATVIASGSDDEKLEIVKAEGAHYVLNVKDENFSQRILELTQGKGVDVVLDPVGGDVLDRSLKAVGIGGRVLVVGFAGGRISSVKTNHILFGGLSIIGVPYGGFTKRNPSLWKDMMSVIMHLMARDFIRPRIDGKFGFDEIQTALGQIAYRQTVGKCLLLSDRGLKA